MTRENLLETLKNRFETNMQRHRSLTWDLVEEYFSNTGDKVDTSSFYWTNRIIAALADPHFKLANALIDSYQRKVRINSQKVIAETDKKILELNVSKEEMKKQLEDANEKIAIEAKKLTDEFLLEILDLASNEMRNSFSRSDA